MGLRVDLNLGIPAPVVLAPAPVYVAPAPVYVPPPAVILAPPPAVIIAPRRSWYGYGPPRTGVILEERGRYDARHGWYR